jgi:hypothetical protein
MTASILNQELFLDVLKITAGRACGKMADLPLYIGIYAIAVLAEGG